jgi:hypothetical protein
MLTNVWEEMDHMSVKGMNTTESAAPKRFVLTLWDIFVLMFLYQYFQNWKMIWTSHCEVTVAVSYNYTKMKVFGEKCSKQEDNARSQ